LATRGRLTSIWRRKSLATHVNAMRPAHWRLSKLPFKRRGVFVDQAARRSLRATIQQGLFRGEGKVSQKAQEAVNLLLPPRYGERQVPKPDH